MVKGHAVYYGGQRECTEAHEIEIDVSAPHDDMIDYDGEIVDDGAADDADDDLPPDQTAVDGDRIPQRNHSHTYLPHQRMLRGDAMDSEAGRQEREDNAIVGS